jgi:hypothetical protein
MSQPTAKQVAKEAVQVSLILHPHTKPRALWVARSDRPADMAHAVDVAHREHGVHADLAWLVPASGELVPVLPAP